MPGPKVEPRPFIKWVGGKTYLLPEIKKRIPSAWNPETDPYVEPFLGAGALFWELKPQWPFLSDRNSDLILAWRVVRDRVTELIEKLLVHECAYWGTSTAEQYYYSVRAQFNEPTSDIVDHAARFIFLNKTCFNGLYRMSQHGRFNTPWGKYALRTICDEGLLRACSAVLHRATLVTCDFAELEAQSFGKLCFRDAFIYCDPPYVPISKTSNFTSYTADGFTYKDQLRLAVWAANLRDAGAHIILSQAAYEPLIDQYRHFGFTCDLVQVPRRVNSKGTGRGNVGEYIIY